MESPVALEDSSECVLKGVTPADIELTCSEYFIHWNSCEFSFHHWCLEESPISLRASAAPQLCTYSTKSCLGGLLPPLFSVKAQTRYTCWCYYGTTWGLAFLEEIQLKEAGNVQSLMKKELDCIWERMEMCVRVFVYVCACVRTCVRVQCLCVHILYMHMLWFVHGHAHEADDRAGGPVSLSVEILK